MAIWFNSEDNNLYDDMNGEAMEWPNWPQKMRQLTDAEVKQILEERQEGN